jgi:hypothetical protein
MFPVPDCGCCHANLFRNIFLIQSKLKAATAQVVTESDGIFDKFFRRLNCKGNFDLMCLL